MPPMLSMQLERTEVGVREHNRIARASLHYVAQNHLAFNIPKHFEINPSTRPGGPYGYAKRSIGYIKRKKRMVGHEIPNVLTGGLRSSVLAGSRITATPAKSTLYIKADRPLNDQRRKELEAITPGELLLSTQLAHRVYQSEVDQLDKNPKQRSTI